MRSASVFTKASFSDVANQFCDLRKSELRDSTIGRAYKPAFASFLSIIPDKPLVSYSPIDVQLFIKERLKTVCPTSLNIQLRSLKCLGNWASQMEILPEKNAFNRIKILKTEDKPVRWLTVEEFQTILEAEPSATLKSVYQIAVMTGLRLSALLGLKWQQINREKMTVTLASATSKNGRSQTLPLNPRVIEILNELYKPKNVFDFQKKNSWVPLSTSYVSHQFLKAARKAGLNDCHFHCLRKSFGSWLLQSGKVGIFHVSKLLSHASVTTTEKFYLGLSLENLAESVENLPTF